MQYLVNISIIFFMEKVSKNFFFSIKYLLKVSGLKTMKG